MAEVSRREREKEQHRNDILNAAEEVFAQKGFHGTTVEDVAEKSEFSVGTLYNFFTNKEDLYYSLIGQRFQQMSDKVNEEMDKATDPKSLIEAFIKAKISLSKEHYPFVKIYTRERMGDRFSNNELWREKAGPLMQQVIERLSGAFEQGIKEGIFRDDIKAMDMAIGADGMSDSFMFEWLVNPEKFCFEEKLGVIIELFFAGAGRH